MKNLIKKEFALAMHPTAPLFLALSSMLLIPNYPYLVAFFYTGLSVFFTCLSGRENNDVFYSMTLPVSKKKIVTARFVYVIILELAQVIVAVPFAFIRQKMPVPPNSVGMDAGIALFAFAFVTLAVFNLTFLGSYYKDVKKVGVSFIKGSVSVFFVITVVEVLTHIVPFFRDVLDTPDTVNLAPKLILLAACIIFYALITLFTYLRAVKNFEKQDI
ncbi:MAG: ABC-2 transporter permease [Clostridia bacterium]|nr:ABC-2 transporter permease [Clostridia bacterium]